MTKKRCFQKKSLRYTVSCYEKSNCGAWVTTEYHPTANGIAKGVRNLCKRQEVNHPASTWMLSLIKAVFQSRIGMVMPSGVAFSFKLLYL